MVVPEFSRRRALEMYPQIARAVPPVPLGRVRESPLRLGQFPHAVANYFWQDHCFVSRRREVHDSTAVIPVTARGTCLYPLRTDGDAMYFDPTIPAQHGDIVLFQFIDDDSNRTDDINALHFMSKMLVEFADEYFLAFRDGMFPLGDIRILGVEVVPPALGIAPTPVTSIAQESQS